MSTEELVGDTEIIDVSDLVEEWPPRASRAWSAVKRALRLAGGGCFIFLFGVVTGWAAQPILVHGVEAAADLVPH